MVTSISSGKASASVAGPSTHILSQAASTASASTSDAHSAQSLRLRKGNTARQSGNAKQVLPSSPSLADQVGNSNVTKNVVVLGGSYGGMHAASVLAQRLPPTHRVILIERNSHFNHLYVFPRFSTLPGHEHKAFIPYSSIFKDAPKRPRRTSNRQPGRAVGPASHLDETNAAPSSSSSRRTQPNGISGDATASSSEKMLGMGSVSGDAPSRSKMSSGSDWSDESGYDRQSRFTSSASRSSSEESLFERDEALRRSRSTAASSLSSSVDGHHRPASQSSDERTAKAEQLAGAPGLEDALPKEGESARAEEKLGRPEIEVDDLSGALERGINLDGVEPGIEEEMLEDEDLPQDFREASPHVVLQASVSDITPTHVVVETSRDAAGSKTASKGKLWSIDSISIPYTHLVYALGSHLPDPLRTEARTKPSGMSWMRDMQERVKTSREIVLVGGGALGVEFATDIKSVHPEKDVTLIHSRKQLLPNFDYKVHQAAYERLTELGVKLVLGERLALTEGCPRGSTVRPEHVASAGPPQQAEVCPPLDKRGEGLQARNEGMCLGDGRKRVKTTGGREFECDLLLLCTGQQPNSSLMAHLSPTSVDPSTRLVRVHRSLQVKVPDPQDSLAQMPFDARPPCGDCDCFLDKKAAGAERASEEHESGGEHNPEHKDGRLPNVFAIGDVADAFGALNAGYQAWNMADVAAENILRDIQASDAKDAAADLDLDGRLSESALQAFNPPVSMLKLSLGLGKMVMQGAPAEDGDGQPVVEVRDDPDDLSVEGVWKFMAGMPTDDMYL